MRRQTECILITLLLSLGTACLVLVVGNASAQGGTWSAPIDLSNTVTGSYSPRLVMDQQQTLHLVWSDWVDAIPHWPYVLYAQKPKTGPWTAWAFLPGQLKGRLPAMAAGSDGVLHIVMQRQEGIGYIRRYPDGLWSALEALSGPAGTNPDVAVAPNGTVHVAFADSTGSGSPTLIYHRSRAPGGAWSAPVPVSTSGGSAPVPLIAVDTTGVVHLIMADGTSGDFEYAYRAPGDAWSEPEALPYDPTPWNTVEQLASDSQGKVHLVWSEWYGGTSAGPCVVLHATKASTEPWSSPELLAEDCATRVAVTADEHGLVHVTWNAGGHLWTIAQGPAEVWGMPTSVDVDAGTYTQDSELSFVAHGRSGRHLAWDFGPGGISDIWYTGATSWPPVTVTITVDGGRLRSAKGDTTLDFPPGAVADDTIVTHTPQAPLLGGDVAALCLFDLSARRKSDGAPVTSFLAPYTLTFRYLEAEKGGVMEDTLGLYWWDGDEWIREASSSADPAQNRVTATPNHMTLFAVLGETHRLFLPLVQRAH